MGEFIRELRRLSGLTQEQLAAKLAVTFSTVNRWENGHSKPSSMAIKLIEGILHDLGQKGSELLVKYSK